MTDRLDEMLLNQRMFQAQLNGYDVAEQTNEQRITNFKESLFALEHELHEAVDELGWKSWATSRHFNTEEVRKELVDAWHFFMNLMLHAGMSADDLYKGYLRKLGINQQRQADGYDGIIGKCPQCRRALDDISLREIIVSEPFPRVDVHCVCGRVLFSRAV